MSTPQAAASDRPNADGLARLKRYLQWWFAGILAGDKDRQYELIAFSGASINGLFALVAPNPIGNITNGVCAVIISGLLALHHWRPQYRVASMWVLWGSLHVGATLGVLWQGGIWSLSMGYFLATAVATLMMINVRAVGVIASVTAVTVAALVWVESHGLMPRSQVAPDNLWWPTLLFVCLIFSVITLPIIAYVTQIQLAKSLSTHNRELRQAQAQLRDQHRQQEQFVASVSHELRTPMNAIMGFLQTVDHSTVEDPQEREMLSLMELSAKQLLVRINELLDFSQLQAGKLRIRHQSFDLHKVANDMAQQFKPELQTKNIALTLDIDPNAPQWVVGDAERIAQVLGNLLSNAAKFTTQGQVSLTLAPLGAQRIRFGVADTGIGIAAEELERVFNRLSPLTSRTRRELGGTGLGLSITKALVLLMGGEMQVKSHIGRGSHFAFELPLSLATDPQVAQSTTAGLAAAVEVRGRVLIVDDSPVNRLVAQNLLKSELPKLEILEAESGERALDIIGRETVHVVLMDVIMPGIGGIEATRRVLTQLGSANITVMGLTADWSEDVRQACLDAGMTTVIAKPFNRATLSQAVRQALAQAPRGATATGHPA
jgi:signal transduction histidine kinase